MTSLNYLDFMLKVPNSQVLGVGFVCDPEKILPNARTKLGLGVHLFVGPKATFTNLRSKML